MMILLRRGVMEARFLKLLSRCLKDGIAGFANRVTEREERKNCAQAKNGFTVSAGQHKTRRLIF
jgi:hypothetical protein